MNLTPHRSTRRIYLYRLSVPVLFAVGVLALLLGANASKAQSLTASITLDSTNKRLPFRLVLEQNTRKDVRSIRIQTSAPLRFGAFSAQGAVRFTPIGESMIEIKPMSDTLMLVGKELILGRFVTNNSTFEQRFTISFFDRNQNLLAQQKIDRPIPQAFKSWFPNPCTQAYVTLNTGLNVGVEPAVEYAENSYDGYWQVHSGLEVQPGPAYVNSKIFSTAQYLYPDLDDVSQWLRADPYAFDDFHNDETIVYRRYFCSDSAGIGLLSFRIIADNSATVRLNGSGTVLQSLSYPGIETFVSEPVNILKGQNFIEVSVLNHDDEDGGPTGFLMTDAWIQLTGAHLFLASAACPCDPRGSIIIKKIWDKNCDGKIQNGESGVAGWKVSLQPLPTGTVQTVQTDANGMAIFANVQVGAYVLTEESSANHPGFLWTFIRSVQCDGRNKSYLDSDLPEL